MSITAQDIFYDARALLDEWTDDGVILPDADVADLQAKSIRFTNMAQRELYKISKLYNTFEYDQKVVNNLLGDGAEFDLVDYIGVAQYYPNETGIAGADAYYFEADYTATVELQENQSGTWTTLTTVSPPSTLTQLTAYSGSITPVSADNNIRFKFSGSTHYRHKNRALFGYPYASAKIPTYKPYVKVEMPSDFQTIDQIVSEIASSHYTGHSIYKWQGYKDLYVSYYFEGTLKIVYRPIPTKITAITDTLEIDDITAEIISYYVAARLASFENTSLVNYFEQKYEERKAELMNDKPSSEETVQDVYGFGGEGDGSVYSF